MKKNPVMEENPVSWSYYAEVLTKIVNDALRGDRPEWTDKTLWVLQSHGIPNAIVARLVKSMKQPRVFNVLGPIYSRALHDALHLTPQQQCQLAAATLVAGFQRQLTNVLPLGKEHLALATVKMLYPSVVAALAADSASYKGFFEEFQEEASRIVSSETELERELQPALEYLDQAKLLLQVSRSKVTPQDAIQDSLQARYALRRALVELEALLPETQKTDDWRVWRQEAEAELYHVTTFLEHYGL